MSRIRVAADAAETVAAGLAAIREEFEVPGEFPAEVLREADAAAASWEEADRPDRTDLPLVTIDPATATDLDQAFALEVDGDDLVLRYAIADLERVRAARRRDGTRALAAGCHRLPAGQQGEPAPARPLGGRRQPAPR